MSTDRNPFAALKNAALAFFRHELVIQRGDAGVRLALAQRVDGVIAPPPPSRAELAAQRAREDLERARVELAALLEEERGQPGHAAHPLLQIEQALQEHGWKALDWVSLQTLGDALAQFESMVTNWSPTGLACLRSKMAVALVERENQEAVTEPALMPHAAEARTELPGQAPQPDPAEADSDEPDAALLAAYAAFGVGTPEAETAVREVDLQL